MMSHIFAIQVGKQVEDEKLAALGARNMLKSMTEARYVTPPKKINLKNNWIRFMYRFIPRKQQHQQLTALIVEKKHEFERLRINYESLLKDQAEQQEFIEHFMSQKWVKYTIKYSFKIHIHYSVVLMTDV